MREPCCSDNLIAKQEVVETPHPTSPVSETSQSPDVDSGECALERLLMRRGVKGEGPLIVKYSIAKLESLQPDLRYSDKTTDLTCIVHCHNEPTCSFQECATYPQVRRA